LWFLYLLPTLIIYHKPLVMNRFKLIIFAIQINELRRVALNGEIGVISTPAIRGHRRGSAKRDISDAFTTAHNTASTPNAQHIFEFTNDRRIRRT
jgi:hypothetical protein